MGALAIGSIALQASESRVPTFPRQIVSVIGTSIPRYRRAKNGNFVSVTNYAVIKHADGTNVITRVGDSCRCVRECGGTCMCIRYSDA